MVIWPLISISDLPTSAVRSLKSRIMSLTTAENQLEVTIASFLLDFQRPVVDGSSSELKTNLQGPYSSNSVVSALPDCTTNLGMTAELWKAIVIPSLTENSLSNGVFHVSCIFAF